MPSAGRSRQPLLVVSQATPAPRASAKPKASVNRPRWVLRKRTKTDMANSGYERTVPESPRLPIIRWAGALALGALVVACQSKPLAEATGGSGPGSAGATTSTGGSNPAGDAGAGSTGGNNPAGDAGAGGESAALGDPATVPILTGVHISSDEGAENFQRALAEVDFGRASVARATLRVTLQSPCFPFEGWAEQGVPTGQRWPAACDAFDRTLSVTLDHDPENAGAPGFELLRAITPFGGPLQVETDVTDIVNGLPGSHQLGLKIDTWSDADGLVSGSKGEWIASAELLLWRGAAPRQVLAVLPLLLEGQTEPTAAPLTFEVPEGAGSARIEYRATGHGGAFSPGCLGPADEFCKRMHELRLDGELLEELQPWRDCSDFCSLTVNDAGVGPAQYCAENPCADPNSARAPRANWCPGSQTDAFVLQGPDLIVAGEHELTRSISAIAAGGVWTVSATYFAFE